MNVANESELTPLQQEWKIERQKGMEIVTITMERRRIPHLLGALRLGIWLEGACAELSHSAYQCYDSVSRRWCGDVADTIEAIKSQTGVSLEYKGDGEDWSLKIIGTDVNTRCAELIKEDEERKNAEQKAYEESIQKSNDQSS
jgi:hypothetical protein